MQPIVFYSNIYIYIDSICYNNRNEIHQYDNGNRHTAMINADKNNLFYLKQDMTGKNGLHSMEQWTKLVSDEFKMRYILPIMTALLNTNVFGVWNSFKIQLILNP